jgi:hypothetical protein
MSTHPRGHPDYATVARWQHKLASRVVLQAFKDLRNRHGPEEERASARDFLAGSAMLRYWCLVGSLDLDRITRRVRRGSIAMESANEGDIDGTQRAHHR